MDEGTKFGLTMVLVSAAEHSETVVWVNRRSDLAPAWINRVDTAYQEGGQGQADHHASGRRGQSSHDGRWLLSVALRGPWRHERNPVSMLSAPWRYSLAYLA